MRYRVSIRNHKYGFIGRMRVKLPIGPVSNPWVVHQVRGGNRSFATFAEAVEFVDNGSWS